MIRAPINVGQPPIGSVANNLVQAKFAAAQAAGGQPTLGGLVTMVEAPEAPMGSGIVVDNR